MAVSAHRALLDKHRSTITETMDPERLVDELIELEMLDEEAYLATLSTDAPQWNTNLLNHFESNCTDDVYEKFVEVLQGMHFIENVVQSDKGPPAQPVRKNSDDDRVRRTAILGGFPELPRNFSGRRALTEAIRAKIMHLQWDEKVVVHGMTGYGKSTLVANVLYDNDVMAQFNYRLFWINLGEHQNANNLLTAMWRLYLNVVQYTATDPLPHCPTDIAELKIKLIDLFLSDRLKHALLVLDDVMCREVFQAFDLKCRLVITTQNKDVVSPFSHSHFIEVNAGLSLDETLDLFRISLQVPEVCEQAKEIHALSKGFPMSIAMVCSFLASSREAAINGTKIWDSLICEFKEFVTGSLMTKTDKAIEMCIAKLPAEMQEHYMDLVVFDEDVNIMPKVLQTFWALDENRVRNIMIQFANKSLIVQYYHQEFDDYIYGIHDLLLGYLKKKCSPEDICHRHSKLLHNYLDMMMTTNSPIEHHLPNDNYILGYIGYHLKHAKWYSMFSRLYYDLRFIEAKIRAVGHADILRDFDIYKQWIINGEEQNTNTEAGEAKWHDYKKFVEDYGSTIFNQKCVDIVQFGLQGPNTNWVNHDATQLAKRNAEQLYFKFYQNKSQPKNWIVKLDEEATAVSFANNNQSILVGTAQGHIFKYDREKKIHNFVGHGDAINSICVSPDKRYFLSVSTDKSVKLWQFPMATARSPSSSENTIHGGTLSSPKEKQSFWKDLHLPDHYQRPHCDLKMKSDSRSNSRSNDVDFIVSATFANNFVTTRQIATGSNRGVVVIWDEFGVLVSSSTARGRPAKSILLFDDIILFACDSDIVILDRSDCQHLQTINSTCGDVNHILSLGNCISDRILAVGEEKITLWHLEHQHHEELFEHNALIQCATSSDDGKYVVIGDANRFVCIYDMEQREVADVLEKSHGSAQSLDVSHDCNSLLILLVGNDQRTLTKYQIMNHPKNLSNLTGRWPLLAYTTNGGTTLQVLKGATKFFDQSYAFEVKSVCIAAGNQMDVIYGLSNGRVMSHNTKTLITTCLMECKGSVTRVQSLPTNFGQILIVSSGRSVTISMNKVDIVIMDIEEPLFCNVAEIRPTSHPYTLLQIVDRRCWMFRIKLADNQEVKRYRLRNIGDDSVTAAQFHSNGMLAVGTLDARLYVFNVLNTTTYNGVHCNGSTNDVDVDYQPITIFEKRVPKSVRSIAFSNDGSLLAVGLFNCNILVYNMESFKHLELKLHESPVERLYFSPNDDLILVSQADLVAFWNLKEFRGKSKRTIANTNTASVAVTNSVWESKRPSRRHNVAHLLACVKLHGSFVKFLLPSQDFTSFMAVDNESNIYRMEIFNM